MNQMKLYQFSIWLVDLPPVQDRDTIKIIPTSLLFCQTSPPLLSHPQKYRYYFLAIPNNILKKLFSIKVFGLNLNVGMDDDFFLDYLTFFCNLFAIFHVKDCKFYGD